MRFSIDRRKFLQAVSVAGAGIPLLRQTVAAGQEAAIPGSAQVENDFFRARFDTATGRLDAWRNDGRMFLSNAVSRVVTPTAARNTADSEYERTVESTDIRDSLGMGRQLRARCVDRRRQVDFEVRVTLYNGRNALVAETICRNPSRKDSLVLRSIEPVRAVFDEGGTCNWTGSQKVLTNGYLYNDPGHVQDFGFLRRRLTQSLWSMAFYRGEHAEGLVIGFLENNAGDGRISAWTDVTVVLPTRLSPFGFALVTESLLNREFVLKPGASATSGRLIFNLAPDPFTALESYAQAMGDLHQVQLNPIINGWCSWFAGRHLYSTEEEQLKNAEFIAKHLKPYGMEWIQIDDGYQRAFGDWEGNKLYPHGMKWLAGKIREMGLRAGIWVAPYCISEGTDVAKNHPEWLVHDVGGNVQENIASDRAKYALDITHPGAADWMRKLFHTMANDWGYDFFKIDFVEWTLLAADRYYDPGVSKAAAYRRGFEIIRQGIGAHRHLLDCGPAPNTVGLLDSTRIERDMWHLNWEQYAKNYNSTAPAVAKRYYFHKRAWINDADHLGLTLLTIPQGQAAASIIALSGGTVISGDQLEELDPARLAILQKILPAYGEVARPIDLFQKSFPEIFALKISKNFGEWWLVGYFNWDEEATIARVLDLSRLGLDSGKPHLVYEFWSQHLIAEVMRRVKLLLGPSSVNLVAIREKSGVPQVVSTDRHYTQGALELENVHWDPSNNELQAVSLGAVGTAHNISIYIPENYRWEAEPPHYYYDYQGYFLRLIEPNILRVHVRFENSRRMVWKVRFKVRS